jgi:hypothetical protein
MKARCILFVAGQLFVAAVGSAQGGAAEQPATAPIAPSAAHVVKLPSSLQWTPIAPAGAELAVVSGDPDKPGAPFVIRIKNPDG